jgi:cellulose synthase operon protein C
MPRTHALTAAFAAAIAAALPALAADESVVNGLVRNAWYWQARARSDKAEEAWKQVLEAAPDNADALTAIGTFHARAGRLQQAREALAKLEKLAPSHPDLPVLRRAIQLGTRYGPLLAQARKLAHEGRSAEAATRYRELFGDAGPPGDLALEYYQTIGGAPGGWEEARDGLRRMVRRAPFEPRYRLALAKHYTYREQTRREGIDLLASLSRDPTVGKEAAASWRQALLWLPPNEQNLPLLRAYMRTHPNDVQMARHIDRAKMAGTVSEGYAALERGDLRNAERLFQMAGDDPDAQRGLSLLRDRRIGQAKKAGFAALERGDLRDAETMFQMAGNDSDARLGLALVAQRQALQAERDEDFPRARALLEQSRRLAPQRRDIWEEPLRTVTFWGLMRDARAAREAGRDAEAEAKLTEAMQFAPPDERWRVQLGIADLYLARGDHRSAERRYRDVLAAKPNQPDALRALTGILVTDGRFDDAVPVNDTLLRVAPQKAFRPEWLKAEILRSRAARNKDAHEPEKARADLEAAYKLDPTDIWVLHDLSNILIETGGLREAQTTVAQLLKMAPALPEARVVQARLLMAQHEDERALAVLASIDPPPRDPAVVELRRRLEVQVQIPGLLAAAAAGSRAEAVQGLAALQRKFGDEPELAAQIAVAWSRLGERGRAVALMRSAVAKAPNATRGARLQLAAALLDSGDDAAVGQMLSGLERDPTLSPPERRSLGELRVAYAVRTADRNRERDDFAGAAAVLDSVTRDYPRDPRLLAARGRLIEHQNPAAAHKLFLDALASAPDDFEALRGAADTAMALRKLDEARDLSNEAVRRHPYDPQAYLLAARAAELQGDDGEAMTSLERGLRLLDLAASPAPVRPAAEIQPGSSVASVPEGVPRRTALGVGPTDAELRERVVAEMDRIRSRHRPAAVAEGDGRFRNGEVGFSALYELRQSLHLETSIGYSGRGAAHVSEVELDAGTPGRTAGSRFGSGAPPAGAPTAGAQRATGTEVRLSYESRHFVADVGTTPIGFPVLSIVGGARLRGTFGPVSLSVEGGSRSVTDSLLSYAGTADPRTGRNWGGVVARGGRLELGLDVGPVNLFGYGEYHRLIGVRVEENQRAAGGGGIELKLYQGPLGDFRMGPTVSLMSYQYNLSFFTIGHGGYFSPQQFFHGGFALRWSGNGTGSLRWDVAAEPGFDTFRQNSAPMFPLNLPGDPTGAAPYPALSNHGVSFNGHAFVGWAIASFFELGLSASVQQAPEFQEYRGGVLLRFGGRPNG